MCPSNPAVLPSSFPAFQVINALWRVLTHDLDRVLKGAANQALYIIRDQADGTSAAVATDVSADEAAQVLAIMAKIFMVSFFFALPGCLH